MERKLESYKTDLALDPEFNLIDGFRTFDSEDKGYITLSEFRAGLREMSIIPGYEEMAMLFNRYDRDQDGRLKYSDYCDMVSPKNHQYNKLLSNRLPSRPIVYAPKTRVLYTALLETSMDVERQGQQLRRRLDKDPYFSAYDAFRCADVSGKGYVSLNAVSDPSTSQLQDFLRQNKVYATEAELYGLFDRYDQNKDGRITLSEVRPQLSLSLFMK